jgi:predicted HTH transcriptional regulator
LKPLVISSKEENQFLVRELIDSGEGFQIEFKKSFLKSSETQDEVMNQISGFANSEGGYLMIGVEDDKTISGVDSEIKQAGSQDGYSKRVVNIAKEALFPFIPSLFVLDFVQIEEKTVLVIKINESNTEIVFRKIKGKSDECYARTNSGIQKLDHQGLLVLYKKRTNDQK